MNSAAIFCVFTIVIASVHGGSQRVRRLAGRDGVGINAVGASQAIGNGTTISEQNSVLSVSGSPDVPALLSFGAGTNAVLNQGVSNYQQTQINPDGASSAYQGNSAVNDANAYDFLSAGGQGLDIVVDTNGWSAAEGQGAIGQVDTLEHTSSGSGWSTPGWSTPGWSTPGWSQ